MSQESRKQAFQVVALICLLGILGFAIWFQFLRPQKTAAPEVVHRASAGMPAAAGAAGATPGASDAAAKPAYGTTGVEQAQNQAAGKAAPEPLTKSTGLSSLEMNPNQFMVFSLSPPKNPFVQQERWYADKLAELPGYPELRDKDYPRRGLR